MIYSHSYLCLIILNFLLESSNQLNSFFFAFFILFVDYFCLIFFLLFFALFFSTNFTIIMNIESQSRVANLIFGLTNRIRCSFLASWQLTMGEQTNKYLLLKMKIEKNIFKKYFYISRRK